MLLLLTARTIRGAMTRRKPDARNPKRPSSKGGSGPKNRSPEGRERTDKRPGKPSAKPGAKPPAKGAGANRTGAPRPWEINSGRREDARGEPRGDRPDRGPRPQNNRPQDSRPADGRPGPRAERHVTDTGERRPDRGADPRGAGPRPDQRSFDRRSSHHRGDLPVWLYGTHAVLAALNNDDRYVRRLVLTRETRDALGSDMPIPAVQPEILDKLKIDSLLPPGAVHQGIAAMVDPLDDGGVESLKEPLELGSGREVVLLLDHVTDPRNVGAILRSAAAFGARAVIVTDRHAPEATGALAKAASGGLEIVPLIRVTNMARALDLLAEYGFWRVGLEMETEKTLADAVSDIRRVALVLGSEDEGLRRLTREKCDFLAKLPMTGAVESLNVSAAAAIALYECVRG